MAEIVETGTILIKEGTLLPEALRLEYEPYTPGWSVVTNLDGHGLDREISRVRWTFFYLAGEIQATILGSYGPETVRRAIKRILSMRKLRAFNSLEVTGVVQERFLGIPYIAVTAHSRHVQRSLLLLRGPCPSALGRATRVAA